LHARRLVEMAMAVIIGHFFLKQAAKLPRKKTIAKYFIAREMPRIEGHLLAVLSGNQMAVENYLEIVGPVPEVE